MAKDMTVDELNTVPYLREDAVNVDVNGNADNMTNGNLAEEDDTMVNGNDNLAEEDDTMVNGNGNLAEVDDTQVNGASSESDVSMEEGGEEGLDGHPAYRADANDPITCRVNVLQQLERLGLLRTSRAFSTTKLAV